MTFAVVYGHQVQTRQDQVHKVLPQDIVTMDGRRRLRNGCRLPKSRIDANVLRVRPCTALELMGSSPAKLRCKGDGFFLSLLTRQQMYAIIPAMTSEPAALLRPGGRFGEFTVVEELGAGGMGAVYRVRAPGIETDLVVKVMRPELESREFKRRFIREAEIAMKVRHPNLVRVYEVGRDPETGLGFMVMDYESGGSLRDRMADKLMDGRHFTVREALYVVRKIAEALEAAAAAGVIHRDVKPDNILFVAADEPMLADLGVAKKEDGSEGESSNCCGACATRDRSTASPRRGRWCGSSTTGATSRSGDSARSSSGPCP